MGNRQGKNNIPDLSRFKTDLNQLKQYLDHSTWIGSKPEDCMAPKGYYFVIIRHGDDGYRNMCYHHGRINLYLNKQGLVDHWNEG